MAYEIGLFFFFFNSIAKGKELARRPTETYLSAEEESHDL